jgi:hypothetical protein
VWACLDAHPGFRHAQIFADQDFAEIIPVRGRKYLVRDFTKGMPLPSLWWEVRRKLSALIGGTGPLDVGRYNEMRGSMYDTLAASVPVVDDGAATWGGIRNIHIGLDIGAAVGTPVGRVLCSALTMLPVVTSPHLPAR